MRVLKTVLGAVAMAAALPAAAADITVLRGDAVETVSVSSDGPTILRGGGTMQAKPPKETAAPLPRTAYAGNTLWLVAENGPVTACFLLRTEYVGRRKIRCTTSRY